MAIFMAMDQIVVHSRYVRTRAVWVQLVDSTEQTRVGGLTRAGGAFSSRITAGRHLRAAVHRAHR
ncbi:hypothetical protein XaCFBP7622_18245 [Xanthomonas arboricola]|nr:hypothetical protein XaCFBP7622_18245 [Xanthomonas arboricola]